MQMYIPQTINIQKFNICHKNCEQKSTSTLYTIYNQKNMDSVQTQENRNPKATLWNFRIGPEGDTRDTQTENLKAYP